MSRLIPVCLLLATLAGCTNPQAEKATEKPLTEAAKQFRPVLVVAEEPAGAKTVIEVRDQLASQAEGTETPEPAPVVVVGVIGGNMPNPFGDQGSADFPWFPEMAAFSLVDPTTAEEFAGSEHEHAEGDDCIWCTRTAEKLADTVATVTFKDSTGELIAERADTLLGLKKGDTVVVEGTGTVGLGSLKIDATHIYVRP